MYQKLSVIKQREMKLQMFSRLEGKFRFLLTIMSL